MEDANAYKSCEAVLCMESLARAAPDDDEEEEREGNEEMDAVTAAASLTHLDNCKLFQVGNSESDEEVDEPCMVFAYALDVD